MKSKNRRIVKALRAAKGYLWNGKGFNTANLHKYICWAITDSEVEEVTYHSIRDAVAVIEKRLGPFETVDGYLKSLGIPKKDLVAENVQAFRHRWLDALIIEFNK